MKKYELVFQPLENLYRIMALRNIIDLSTGQIICEKGKLGGFVENPYNLSQVGECWIKNEAKAIGHSKVKGNALVTDSAIISGQAIVSDNAQVSGNATVTDSALIDGNALVTSYSRVKDNVHISEQATITGQALVSGNAFISGRCIIDLSSTVTEDAHIGGRVTLSDKVLVGGHIRLYGLFSITGDAVIKEDRDFLVFKNWWSSGRYFVWTRSNDMWHVGCFHGNSEELLFKANRDDISNEEINSCGGSKLREYMRILKYVDEIKKYL